MNVSLTRELEQYIQAKVSGGLYSSASEVIRESLRLMHSYDDLQQKKMRDLNKDIEAGLLPLRQGKKVSAAESYQKLKSKIEKISLEKR